MRPCPHSRPLARKAVAILCLLLVAAFSAACQDDEAKVAEHLEQAHAYSEAGQYAEAIIEYRSLLQIDPNNAEAHYQLANSYLRTQQMREAIWEFGEAVRLDPSNVDARLSLGALLLVAKDFTGLEEQARAAIELAPDDAKGYALLGQALQRLKRPDDAESAFLKAVELEPETSQYLMVLASYYWRQGNRSAAEPPFVKYTEMSPSVESYSALGRFLAEDPSREAEAQKAFEAARDVAKGKEVGPAYQTLANFHFENGRKELAIETLKTASELLKDDPDQQVEVIYHLARFLGRMGDPEGAAAMLESAAEVKPDDVKPHMVLARTRSANGDVEGALAAIDKALAIDPTSSRPLLAKAEILIEIGFSENDPARIAEGAAIVEKALADEPTNSNALFVQAKLALAQGDGEAAAKAARAAVDSRPNWAQGHLVLGQALTASGNASGARAEVARAVELDPSLLEARRALALLHANLGEHEYAIEQGRIFLRSNPDDVEMRILVAQSLARLGRTEEALAEIPKAGGGAQVSFAQGQLLLAEGKLAEARAALLQADQEAPHNPEILRALLNTEGQLDKLDEAGARIEAAIAANPENAELVRLDGTYALRQGDTDKAQKRFERAIELDPENLAAYEQLARLYQSAGRVDEAMATYQDAIEKRPDSARLHNFLAVLYEMKGRTAEAIKGYEKAIELDEGMAHAKNNLAYLLADSGEDLDRALDLAQEAKQQMPESPNAADTLGWVLYRRGIPSAAVGYLREAIAGMESGSPEISMVRHHLALAYEANNQKDMAINELETSLAELEAQQSKVRASGGTPQDPPWSGEAREMLARLRGAG